MRAYSHGCFVFIALFVWCVLTKRWREVKSHKILVRFFQRGSLVSSDQEGYKASDITIYLLYVLILLTSLHEISRFYMSWSLLPSSSRASTIWTNVHSEDWMCMHVSMCYKGIARTIPPGGYKNFRLGWVWGGISRICQLASPTNLGRGIRTCTLGWDLEGGIGKFGGYSSSDSLVVLKLPSQIL